MNASIQSQHHAALKPEPKYCRVLRRLLAGPLHRFEAEKFPVSDHCLSSTVSELKRRGVEIRTQMVRLPGYGGLGAYVAEYALAPESRQRALELVEAARSE